MGRITRGAAGVGIIVGLLAVPIGVVSGHSVEPRVIEIEIEQAGLTQSDRPLTDIRVTPGETVIFRIDNASGVRHNFYIGNDEELSGPLATTDVGLDNWIGDLDPVRYLEWTVPQDVAGLKFGSTTIAESATMQGAFSSDHSAPPERPWPPFWFSTLP